LRAGPFRGKEKYNGATLQNPILLNRSSPTNVNNISYIGGDYKVLCENNLGQTLQPKNLAHFTPLIKPDFVFYTIKIDIKISVITPNNLRNWTEN